MDIVYSPDHRLHNGRFEMKDGEFTPCHECPDRADRIFEALKDNADFNFLAPDADASAVIRQIHSPDYVAFLETAWPKWMDFKGTSNPPDAFPLIFPNRSRNVHAPSSIDGLLGYYALDTGSPIMSGTFDAARTAASCALTGQRLVTTGGRTVFSLSRPPGHHATHDAYGGYCFFNNAAIAAQGFLNDGAARVAILDVDYHHGNGTQDIFYERSDVLVVNIHADPSSEYPFFWGARTEIGAGTGAGYNLNLPLPAGTDWPAYAEALGQACAAIRKYAPDALILSFGFDIFHGDPLSRFLIGTADFRRIAGMIAALKFPTLIILEGGYAIDGLADNVLSGLTGFLETE